LLLFSIVTIMFVVMSLSWHNIIIILHVNVKAQKRLLSVLFVLRLQGLAGTRTWPTRSQPPKATLGTLPSLRARAMAMGL
jgi:hypothetical protein